jgi:hypothetical protein
MLKGNLCSKTGEWTPVEGETYWADKAETAGESYLQRAVSTCSEHLPLTGLTASGRASQGAD